MYPSEDALLDKFKYFISTTNFTDLYNRKNFIGHITASAIVIDVEESKILLINHINLGKWLPPGGHVEYSDNSILDANIDTCQFISNNLVLKTCTETVNNSNFFYNALVMDYGNPVHLNYCTFMFNSATMNTDINGTVLNCTFDSNGR